jgi:uncharacterized OB-fold protein
VTLEYNVSAIVNANNAEYLRLLRRGDLRMQACRGCGYVRTPPRPICPQCLSEESDWKRMCGQGIVETYIWYFKNILDRRYTNDWAYQDAPYNVALVRLAEGPRVLTNVENTTFEALRAGQTVTAKFIPISDAYAILRFMPEE